MKKVKPGHTVFEYNSMNTLVLELIVNQVTGKPLSEVFGGESGAKIGAQNDAFIGVTKYGLGNSWGFMNCTPARFWTLGYDIYPKFARNRRGTDHYRTAVLKTIQTGGRPEIYLGGFVGER